VVHKKTKRILCTAHGRGKMHDFRLYQKSKIGPHKSTRMDLDLGYWGMDKLHENVRLPRKSSKYHELTKSEKAYNKRLARSRVLVEHVIRRIKVFRMMSETYRNRRRKYDVTLQHEK